MRIAIAQLNPTIGGLAANVDALIAAYADACAGGADFVVAPELAITGYPPRDLLDRPAFVRDAIQSLGKLAAAIEGEVPMVVGTVVGAGADCLSPESQIANAAVVLRRGRVEACHRKMLLPTYDVFDEFRYFKPGLTPTVHLIAGVPVGLSVCEDIWNDKGSLSLRSYARDPVSEAVSSGAQIIVNVSASPYDRHKPSERRRVLAAVARRLGRPVIYANQVGGNDSLIFDGRSCAFDSQGTLACRAPAYVPCVHFVDVEGESVTGQSASDEDTWEGDATQALCLGLRDYVQKCGFERVVIGLSGGIDSALTASLAARALGPARVIGLAMPSRYSSDGSLRDAEALAEACGIRLHTLPIEPMFNSFGRALAPYFAGLEPDSTEENLQARIRGTLLMAYSNKMGALLLTTGNKSELAVGYCTLYGDMCGGLAVISDLYKTEVYALSRHINRAFEHPYIPQSTITKPPSAELRPDQTDQDSLPPYPELDAVLRGYIDEALGVKELIARGHPKALVERVVRMVDLSEYKRRQMPPGLRISRKAFGEGRRLPIAQRYSSATAVVPAPTAPQETPPPLEAED